MKKNIKNKKGIIYTLVASFMVAVVIILFTVRTETTFGEQQQVYRERIRTMDDFIKNFNTDIHRATYISSFRALLALEDRVTFYGKYLNDTNASFKEAFYYGTFNGTNVTIMENSSLNNYVNKVRQLANQVGVNLTVNITDVKLEQTSPWTINVYVYASINMTDSKRLASWNYNKKYTTELSILDLRDPLYGKGTNNKVPNTIRVLNYTVLVNKTNNDTTKLQEFINGSYYIASNFAPNFLMRFEGKTSADPNGIESIVNIQSLSDQGIIVDNNRIKVDYVYFNNISLTKLCNVDTIPANLYFVVPDDREDLYQIDDLTYNTSVACP